MGEKLLFSVELVGGPLCGSLVLWAGEAGGRFELMRLVLEVQVSHPTDPSDRVPVWHFDPLGRSPKSSSYELRLVWRENGVNKGMAVAVS